MVNFKLHVCYTVIFLDDFPTFLPKAVKLNRKFLLCYIVIRFSAVLPDVLAKMTLMLNFDF